MGLSVRMGHVLAFEAHAPGAMAQGYPNEPVRLAIPFTPGSASDASRQRMLVGKRVCGGVIPIEVVTWLPDRYAMMKIATALPNRSQPLQQIPNKAKTACRRTRLFLQLQEESRRPGEGSDGGTGIHASQNDRRAFARLTATMRRQSR